MVMLNNYLGLLIYIVAIKLGYIDIFHVSPLIAIRSVYFDDLS